MKSSLKEYYIKIQELYNNAVNMLTAINQSFNSKSTEISVNFVDTNNVTQNVRIPSFLYLESKIEELDNSLSNIINIPKSGEAWFTDSKNMHKIEFVKSSTAPIVPTVDDSKINTVSKDLNIFKDMISPRTYLKMDLTNIPDNIEKMYVKKIIINSYDLFESIKNANISSYEEYHAYLINLTNGREYNEYDTEIKLPVRRDKFKSEFKIIDIPNNEQNPWINELGNNVYNIVLDTITYYDEETNMSFLLHEGQYITLSDNYVIYKVLSVSTIKNVNNVSNHIISIEEIIGHVALQTFEENSQMVLKLYNVDFNEFHYIEVPVDENQYMILFLSTLYNNVRSSFSKPIILNMNEINMIDSSGNPILYNGKEISYIDYYNKYCKNVGDLLIGMSEISYPQLSNYSFSELQTLVNGEGVQSMVTNTISDDNLRVQRINTHLIDDEYSNQLVNLHAKKIELNEQLTALQDNINDTYNILIDDSTNHTLIEKTNLKNKLDSYYTEKQKIQKEIIATVDNINILKTNVYGTADAKYRIRGNALVEDIEAYIHDNFSNCSIIGLQYEYKYRSITTDTTNVSNINSSIFTEWNRVTNEDKERKLIFDEVSNTYNLVTVTYDSTQNITKWNQIDIPITQGEDVVLRVRYKYSFGQPFVNLYTPWSDEVTIKFPTEFNDSLELTSIINQNDNDTIVASFMKILIDNGYQEHISNKIIDNSQIFYHMPENIYSGFNTPENNYLSLKDKLQQLTNDIDKYKEMFEIDTMSSYDVYVEYDGTTSKLSKTSTNNILFNETHNMVVNNQTYITKQINIIIKNTGSIPLKLYSICPGYTNLSLFEYNSSSDSINLLRNKYKRVPLLFGSTDTNNITDCVYTQKAGQWIYFRNDNAYNDQLKYYQYSGDSSKMTSIMTSDKQYQLGEVQYENTINDIIVESLNSSKSATDFYSKFKTNYNNAISSNVDYDYDVLSNIALKYENIYYVNDEGRYVGFSNVGNIKSLDNFDTQDLFTCVNKDNNVILKTHSVSDMSGAFLIPELPDNKYLLTDNEQYVRQVNVGDSISIPMIFEYYISNNRINNIKNSNKISKYINFDLKTSLSREISHYSLCVSAIYDPSYTLQITTSNENIIDGLLTTNANNTVTTTNTDGTKTISYVSNDLAKVSNSQIVATKSVSDKIIGNDVILRV